MRAVLPCCGPAQIQSLILSSLPKPSPPPHPLQPLYQKPLYLPPLVATASSPRWTGSPRKGDEENNQGKEKNEMESKEKGGAERAAESSSSSPPPPPPPPLQPPEKPLPGDCCGSGCVRCVWDIYYEELDAYNKALSSAQSTEPKADN